MSKKQNEKLGFDQTRPLVDLLYSNAAPNQHIRELVQNGLDAGATRIDLGIDPIGVKDGPKRLMYSDNGHGMDYRELRAYFNHLSASSGPLHPQGNYGIGAKISLLPWNHAGVRIMSWKNGPESGAEIVMSLDDDNEYGLDIHRAEDEDGELVSTTVIAADDRYCPLWVSDPTHPEYTGSGTIVICLGNTGTEDTYFGPPGTEPKVTNLIRQVNTRYFNFGRDVTVRCLVERGNWRTATGTEAIVEEFAEEWESVELVDGTTVHWYVLSPDSLVLKDRYGYRSGFVAALYRDARTGATEIYNATKAGGDTYHRMRLFGVTEPPVQRRVVLLVEAPRANGVIGVSPNAARSSLNYTGNDDLSLPWATWGPEFALSLPAPIRELLDEARGDSGPKRNMKEKLKHLLERMRNQAYRVHDRGAIRISPDVPGQPEAVGDGTPPQSSMTKTVAPRALKTPAANLAADQGTRAEPFNPRLDPPKVCWRSETTEGYSDVLQGRAVIYDYQAPGEVVMNSDFFAFQEELAYWTEQFPQAPPSTIQDVVREEYEAMVCSTIMHLWTRKGTYKNPTDWEQTISSSSLTAVCHGFHPERAIRKALSVKVGKAAA